MNELNKIKELLSIEDFNYSKDWKESNEIGKVDWLIESVKQKSQEIQNLDNRINEIISLLEKKDEEIKYWKSLIGIKV